MARHYFSRTCGTLPSVPALNTHSDCIVQTIGSLVAYFQKFNPTFRLVSRVDRAYDGGTKKTTGITHLGGLGLGGRRRSHSARPGGVAPSAGVHRHPPQGREPHLAMWRLPRRKHGVARHGHVARGRSGAEKAHVCQGGGGTVRLGLARVEERVRCRYSRV